MSFANDRVKDNETGVLREKKLQQWNDLQASRIRKESPCVCLLVGLQ
jgi:hypothetical protein